MAIENQDLVDTNFIIDYLNSINTHKRMLENEKTESFLNMFRAKCQEEETEQYIVEYLNNIGASLDLCLKYDAPELEKLLFKKWTDGKRC